MYAIKIIPHRRSVAATLSLLAILAGLVLPLFTASPVAAVGIALSPTIGAVGSTVTATLTGPLGQYLLGWDSASDTSLGGSSSSAATFNVDFTVPASIGGTHTVYLTSVNGDASTTFTVTPSITVSAASAVKGASISVSGSGFAASETGITVTLAGANVITGASANANGSWSSSFVMPDAPGGSLALVASGAITVAGTNTTAYLTVTPRMTLGATTGSVGTSVTVTGTSFRASETGVAITWDGTTVLANPAVNATGGFTATVTVPETTAGAHSISAYGASTTTAEIGNLSFQVTSGVSVQPAAAATGATITIKGNGFAANETGITVTLDGKQIAGSITASSVGSWSTSYAIPVMAGGNKAIAAYGSITTASVVSPGVVSIASKITLSATQGKVGSEVTMEGSSFGANDSVTILIDGQTAAGAGTVSADANGSWKQTFKIPDAANGAHQFSARGGTVSAGTPLSFTVEGDAIISSTGGNVGTAIKIDGTGFGASRPLTVKYDADNVPVTQSTNGAGSFSVSFPAPASKGGAHKITVSDGVNTKEFSWEMERTAPPVPKLLKPEDGSYPIGFEGLFGDIVVRFTWDNVSDPSGVKYVFQLATDDQFKNMKESSDNLTSTTYTSKVLPLTDFPMNNYYWRVKAVDGASNESAWTKPQSFHAGVMPAWGFGIVGVVILGLCTWGILWATSRPKEPREPRYRAEREPRYKPERERKEPKPNRKPSRGEDEEEYPPLDEDVAPAGPAEADDIDSLVAAKVAGLSDKDIPALARKKEMAARGLTAPAIYKAIARLEMNGAISRNDEGRYITGMLGARPAPGPQVEEEPAPPARPARRETTPEPKPEIIPAPAVNPQEMDATLLKALDGVTESDLPQVAQRPDVQGLGLNLAKLYRQVDRLKAEGKLPLDGRGRFATGSKKKDTGEELLPEIEELPDRPKTRGAPPAAARPSAPVEPADEAGQLVLRTVGGLDAEGVTDLPMRPEYQKLGLNLARVYKTIARLEQEGKVSKDHRGRYQVKGAPPVEAEAAPEPTFEPAAPAPPARDPDEDLVLKAIIGITDAEVTQLAQLPEMKARGLNLSRLYKIVSRLDKDGKVVRDNRGRFQMPGGGSSAVPEEREAKAEATPDKPAYKPTEVTSGLDLRDPYEDTVMNAVVGQNDADVTQLVNADAMKLRGLTLARIYKITARLEKEGKLVRDEKGRYQKAAQKAPSTSGSAFDARPGTPPTTADIMKPAVEYDSRAVEGLVADVMEGLSATDIPSVAKNEALKARGVTLARLFSLCAKLEREGKLIRDEKGKYRKPEGGEPKAV